MSKFLDFLTGKISLGKLGEKIGDIADDVIYTKQEKMADEEAAKRAIEEAEYRLKTLDSEQYNKSLEALTKLEELEVQDKASARSAQVEIAKEAPDKIWGFTVNVHIILSLIILSMYFTLLILKGLGTIVLSDVDTQTFRDIVFFAVTFFFGTSIGSRNKEKILNKNYEGSS